MVYLFSRPGFEPRPVASASRCVTARAICADCFCGNYRIYENSTSPPFPSRRITPIKIHFLQNSALLLTFEWWEIIPGLVVYKSPLVSSPWSTSWRRSGEIYWKKRNFSKSIAQQRITLSRSWAHASLHYPLESVPLISPAPSLGHLVDS